MYFEKYRSLEFELQNFEVTNIYVLAYLDVKPTVFTAIKFD